MPKRAVPSGNILNACVPVPVPASMFILNAPPPCWIQLNTPLSVLKTSLENVMPPAISNALPGFVVPIPTLPSLSMVILTCGLGAVPAELAVVKKSRAMPLAVSDVYDSVALPKMPAKNLGLVVVNSGSVEPNFIPGVYCEVVFIPFAKSSRPGEPCDMDDDPAPVDWSLATRVVLSPCRWKSLVGPVVPIPMLPVGLSMIWLDDEIVSEPTVLLIFEDAPPMSSLACGLVDPIPTFPSDLMVSFSDPAVAKPKVFVVWRNMPLSGSPEKEKAGVPAVPLAARKSLPEVIAVVPFIWRTVEAPATFTTLVDVVRYVLEIVPILVRFRDESITVVPLMAMLPATSSFWAGSVEPMPTLPEKMAFPGPIGALL